MSVVVVGVDFSPLAPRVLDAALAIARTRPQASVHVVHVAKSMGSTVRVELPEEERSLTPKDAAALLADWVQQQVLACGGGVDSARIQSHVRAGSPSTEIGEAAKELDADLVVVGTEAKSKVERFVLGSVADGVVRKAGCPVWVVREKREAD